MSGTAFLEEIVSWDDQKRAEKVDEALPRLIICFHKCQSDDEATGILQLLCQSFVPIVQEDQLEEKVFSKISEQVCELVNHVLEEIQEAVSSTDTQCERLISLLQSVTTVTQCVEECVKHMTGVSDLHTCHVRSLLHCAFHVLNSSYGHCQESSGLYGDHLPALSECLSLVFRTAHSLQMSLLNLVDKLTVSGGEHSDTEISDIAEVCRSLFALCQLVACLDLKLTISIWKAFSKLAGGKAGALQEHLELNSMVSYLCEEINTGLQQLVRNAPPPVDQSDTVNLSQGDEKAFSKSIRILSFQIKVLSALVRDFSVYLTTSVHTICQLLTYLHSVLPPCLSAARLQKKHEDEIRNHLCSAVPLIMSYLVNNTEFVHAMLGNVINESEEGEKKSFPHLLLLVSCVDGVAQASVQCANAWLCPASTAVNSLLTTVFASLRTCHVEMCLPLSLPATPIEGQPQRRVSVYQYVVEHLCAFMASCPASLWNVVEENLLTAALDLNPVAAQAAADCWCFLARYSTADLCWQQTCAVVSLVKCANSRAPSLCGCSIRPLTSLLHRLVKFLTPDHQLALLRLLPPDRELTMWSQIGTGPLGEEAVKELSQSLIPHCLHILQSFSSQSCPSLHHTVSVIPAMECLHSILVHSPKHMSAQQGAQLLDSVCSMWRVVPPDHSFGTPGGDSDVVNCYMTSLITLTSSIAAQLEVRILLKVLTVSHKLLQTSGCDDVCVAVLQLMQALGPLKVPPSFQQGEILRKMGEIFYAGLTSTSPAVQLSALEALTRFAEQTAHETVVSDCLSLDESLQDRVAAYLQRTPHPSGAEFDPCSHLRDQQRYLLNRQSSVGNNSSETEDGQPSSKRLKLQRDGQDNYRKLLADLSQLTEEVEKVKGRGTLPDYFVTEATPLVLRLHSVLEHL